VVDFIVNNIFTDIEFLQNIYMCKNTTWF